jgi:glycosyltransferase involved in cell wall biosynthesis
MSWERLAARWTTVTVCVSSLEAREAAMMGMSGLRLVPNAVDIERFRPVGREEQRRVRDALDLPDAPIVVCIGRLTRQKGQDILVEAWEVVRRKIPDALLVLVGERHLVELPIRRDAPGVRFVGQRVDPERWLMASDVLAVPSRWEGMSYWMLEGLASGRPVVATNVSGAAEAIIAHGAASAGAIVPLDDPSALGHELVRRLEDPALRAAEGVEGRRRAEARHDLRRWRQDLAALTLEATTHVERSARRGRSVSGRRVGPQ